MSFEIYYADGTTFVGKPEDAPVDYAVCIIVPAREVRPTDPPGTFYRPTRIPESDMYAFLDPPPDSWHARGWHGFDKYEDLKRHLKLANLAAGEIRAVIDGIWMESTAYAEIILRAEREHGMTRA